MTEVYATDDGTGLVIVFGLRRRYALSAGMVGLVSGVAAYRISFPGAAVWPLAGAIAVSAAVLALVSFSLLRGMSHHRGERSEEAVWVNMKRAAFSLSVATLIGEAVVFSTAGAVPGASYAAVTAFGLGNLVAAHFIYQGLISWSRASTIGADPSDLINGLSAVLVIMGIGNLFFPADANFVDVLQRQAALGAAGVAIVLLCSTVAVAAIADLSGDRRSWIVGAVCLMSLGPISACLFDPLRGGVAAQGVALLAMSLLILAAGMPRRLHTPVSVERTATSVGALTVAGCAVAMLTVLGFSSGSHRLSTVYCALGAIGVSAQLFRMVRDLEQLQTTRKLALTDDLTGIANRRALLIDLEAALAQDQQCTLFLVDLDDFKLVNDRYGHAVGDELLRHVARSFDTCLPRGARLARLGGDEFAALVTGLREEASRGIGERLIEVSTPHRVVDGRPLRVRASVGVVNRPRLGHPRSSAPSERGQDRVDAAEMLRRADTAMYRAKSTKTGLGVYDPALDALAQEELSLVEDLRETLESGAEQIAVHYQPQVEVVNGDPAGAEALVRWQHPRLGLLSPARFVDLAESNGLMGKLTTRVVMAAARQWISWREMGFDIPISINLSTSCLAQPGLVDLLDDVLALGVDPSRFILEITETSVMADPELALGTMGVLRGRGFEISIDDFGTGYSSLSYLDTLPASEIKIDKTFIDRMLTDDRTAAIVAGTVGLAHRLGMRLVAEGVEDVETLHLVRELGCDISQGYLHARPMPPDEMTSWLLERLEKQVASGTAQDWPVAGRMRAANGHPLA